MENSVENYSLGPGSETVIKFSIHSKGILQIL